MVVCGDTDNGEEMQTPKSKGLEPELPCMKCKALGIQIKFFRGVA